MGSARRRFPSGDFEDAGHEGAVRGAFAAQLLPRLGEDLSGHVAAIVRLDDDRVCFEGEEAGGAAPVVGGHASGAVFDDVQVAAEAVGGADDAGLVADGGLSAGGWGFSPWPRCVRPGTAGSAGIPARV
jgi:hypothetical protein